MNHLASCPFCGGTAELRTTGGWSGIGCNTDKCPALLHALMFRTPEAARAAWNRRVTSGVPPSDDAQRLDWLQGFADVSLEAWFTGAAIERRVTRDGHTIGSGRSLREAIDAARTACPRGPADFPGSAAPGVTAVVPAGYKLMPLEPTMEQLQALAQAAELEQSDLEDHRYDDGTDAARVIYKKLLAATDGVSVDRHQTFSPSDADGGNR